MGAVVGCTRKICMEKNVNELNVDIKENIANLNTLNTNNPLNKHIFTQNSQFHFN